MKDADNPDFRYSDILDHAASGGERALAEVGMRSIHAIDAEIPERMWDPLACEARLLPLLIYAYGVNLYEEVWSEETKRRWINDNWRFLATRGSVKALRTALAASGYDLQQAVRPPQGTFATVDHDKAEIDAWIRRMPSIRITYESRHGIDNGQAFGDEAFADDAAAASDDGRALSGRFAYLRRNGVDTPLVTLTEKVDVEVGTTQVTERFSTTGDAGDAIFAGDAFADADFADAEIEAPQILTTVIDQTYDHVTSAFELSIMRPGLEPLSTRARTESEIGRAGDACFADDAFADANFATENDGPRLLVDVTYLDDPTISLPATAGWSFADVDRVGIDLRTIEAMIDLHTKAAPNDCFADETFASQAYALEEDTSHVDRALRAVEAARGHQDRVLVRFDNLRPLQAGDIVDETTLAGDWVKESL